jgi:pilus assembly protein CpaC
VMLRAGEIAQSSSAKAKVINMLQLPGGAESQQVMLQVRFAEVNRRMLAERGISFFTSGIGFKNTWGRTTTGQFPAPDFDEMQSSKAGDDLTAVSGELAFTDFLNLFVLSAKYDIGAVIRALNQTGAFQSLAEPNLIAYNGQEASFLAGGEFPVPVVQGATGAVTIVFKEFGVRLNFTPTITNSGNIHMEVEPEVSSLDFANGLQIQGFNIPTLRSRRAKTEVELQDGQTFAIAGLIDNTMSENVNKFPILGDIPILGTFFRSKQAQQNRTELLVLVTPHVVQPSSTPPALPTGEPETWNWDKSLREPAGAAGGR